MDNQVIRLARMVISRETHVRPETEWIQERVNRLAEREGIRTRAETDRLIYEKMYARVPQKTDTVKIRYWRTGHHLPSGRDEALAFSKALQLDGRGLLYLLQACMEKSDLLFETEPGSEDPFFSLYRERASLMERLISEYIDQIPPARMIQLNIPYEKLASYVRHLYCLDAVSATVLSRNEEGKRVLQSHFSSNSYESEFLRIRKLLGEIPRRTMLRHVFLLGIPYLNRRLVDERLRGLGYLPLTEGHTSPKGALLDDLVIGLLQLYEENCRGQDPLSCRQWMFERLGSLDRYMEEQGKEEYRFLYFRGLSTMILYKCVMEYYGDSHQYTAQVAMRLAGLYHCQMKFGESRGWYELGYQLYRKAKPVTEAYWADRAEACEKLARIYEYEKDYETAFRYTEEAMEAADAFRMEAERTGSKIWIKKRMRIQYVYLRRARLYFGQGNAEAASRDLEKALQLFPLNPFQQIEFRMLQIQIDLLRGAYEQARQAAVLDLEVSVYYQGESFKDSLSCREQLGDVLNCQGKLQEANREYVRVLDCLREKSSRWYWLIWRWRCYMRFFIC